MTTISVLILNWNGRRWLRNCIAAVLQQSDHAVETLVIDNGSTDGSLELIAHEFPGVRVLPLAKNWGFGAAYNRAIAELDTSRVVLLNNDTVVQPEWLATLNDHLDSKPNAAAVGSMLLFLEHPSIVNHAGGRLTVLGSAYDVAYGVPEQQLRHPGTTTGCATGAAMMIRREAFLEVGGFDENYFAYFEDADLCWRFWLRGEDVGFEPRARVLHAYGGSGGDRVSPFRIRHCQINRLQNMFKHLSARHLLAVMPASLAYDAMRFVELARQGHHRAARALVEGTLHFHRQLPGVLERRSVVQRRRHRSDDDLMRLGVLSGLSESIAEWRRLSKLPSTHTYSRDTAKEASRIER